MSPSIKKIDAEPVPQNGTHEAIRFESGEGRKRLSCLGHIWVPSRTEIQSPLILGLHGYCEYSGHYANVADFLNRQGFVVGMFDFRGHGASEGKRAYVGSFHDYVSDLTAFHELFTDRFPGRPIFLMTHSMGGLVASHWLLLQQGRPNLTGIFMSAPLMGICCKWTRFYQETVSAIANLVWPSLPVPAPRNIVQDLSQDAVYMERRRRDGNITRNVTPGWVVAQKRAIRKVFASSMRFDVPVFVGQAGKEKIVDNERSHLFFERLKAPYKELKVYEGMQHELFMELDREFVLVDLVRWIERCQPTATIEA